MAMPEATNFTHQQYGDYTVVEFKTASLMDPLELERTAAQLYRLVDEEDRRKMVLDFEQVQYISSQAIGILLTLHKKISALKKSELVLVSVGPKLQELLKITRLDRMLKVKKSQAEALRNVTR